MPTPRSWLRVIAPAATLLLCSGIFLARPAAAQMTQKDVQIMARALGQLDPPPSATSVAIIYSASDAASRQQAEAIAGYFGSGLKAGAGMLTARAVDAGTLGDASGFAALVLVPGADAGPAMQAARARHVPCVTGDAEQVRSGACIMSIRSDPKVEILVNHAAAEAAGVGFASAFRMMFHEI